VLTGLGKITGLKLVVLLAFYAAVLRVVGKTEVFKLPQEHGIVMR